MILGFNNSEGVDMFVRNKRGNQMARCLSISWHMCIFWIFISQESRKGYIFIRLCGTLGDISQTIWIRSFNIIYIRGGNTRNGSIYKFKQIRRKWGFIYACILNFSCCRYFHWTCFDNRIYRRDIIYITGNRGTVFTVLTVQRLKFKNG